MIWHQPFVTNTLQALTFTHIQNLWVITYTHPIASITKHPLLFTQNILIFPGSMLLKEKERGSENELKMLK